MNRRGHCNERPSFWAATNYVDPWSFLKNDPTGYRQWIKTLATLDGGDPLHQVVFDEWKHLLEIDLTRLVDTSPLLSSFAQSNAGNTFKRSLDQELMSLDAEKDPNWQENARELIRKKKFT